MFYGFYGEIFMPRTKIPNDVVTAVLTEAGYRCAVPTCRNILAIDIHHIIEVKDGGSNEASNLLALCPTCHALYTRGKISKEAINAWKTVLVSLSHAFDQESISNLLFLYHVEKEIRQNAERLITANHFQKKITIDEKGNINMLKRDAAMDLNLLVFSGDGVLKFSHLIASQLAIYRVAAKSNIDMKYYVTLTDKGKRIVDAWFSGNRQDVKEALGGLVQEQN